MRIVFQDPFASLDPRLSVQAPIIELPRKLQSDKRPSNLFSSPDLKVVRALCPRVIVMQNGKIVEHGAVEDVLTNP